MIKDFYNITEHSQSENNQHKFEIKLNSDCCVYQGHFPGRPIAPGVCNIEMIKECAIQAINTPTALRLGHIKSCQMMEVVDPFKTPTMSMTIDIKPIEDSKYEFIGVLTHKETPYMKMKATLIPSQSL